MQLTKSEIEFIKVNSEMIKGIVEKRLQEIYGFILDEDDDTKLKGEGRMLKDLLISIKQLMEQKPKQSTGI